MGVAVSSSPSDRYNQNAEPFGWQYTRDDLNRHLDRLNNDGTLRAAA